MSREAEPWAELPRVWAQWQDSQTLHPQPLVARGLATAPLSEIGPVASVCIFILCNSTKVLSALSFALSRTRTALLPHSHP